MSHEFNRNSVFRDTSVMFLEQRRSNEPDDNAEATTVPIVNKVKPHQQERILEIHDDASLDNDFIKSSKHSAILITSIEDEPSSNIQHCGESNLRSIKILLPDIVSLVFPYGINNALIPLDNGCGLPSNSGGLLPEKSPFSTIAALRGRVPNSQLNPIVQDMRRIFYKAGRELLPKLEEQAYCQVMARASFLDYLDSGITPQVYSNLLEQNCILAAVVLCCQLELPDDSLYLNVLLWQSPQQITRLMNSLRVVSEVIQKINIYKPFLHQFIHTIFVACSQIQSYLSQVQVARLICVFLLELWQRAQILPGDDISYEIQSFAVTWIQLKEAAILFRAMKVTSLNNK